MDNLNRTARHVEMHQLVRIIQQGAIQGEIPAFRAANSLAFPFSDISAFLSRQERDRIELTCLGLHGVSSPLPHYFITDALEEENDSLREFLGIFNQQIYYAYFKAWQSKHPHLFHDSCLLAHQTLMSLGTDQFSLSDPISRAAALFVQEQRSSHELKSLLTLLLSPIPYRIKSSPPEWIEAQCPARLGMNPAALSVNLTLGKRLPVYSHRMKLVIGPLSLEQIQACESIDWVRRYLNRQVYIDVEWLIQSQAAQSKLNHGMCLGWNSTLGITAKSLIKVQYAA